MEKKLWNRVEFVKTIWDWIDMWRKMEDIRRRKICDVENIIVVPCFCFL